VFAAARIIARIEASTMARTVSCGPGGAVLDGVLKPADAVATMLDGVLMQTSRFDLAFF